MKSWIRIIVAIFILIGGTAFFGYWSMSQFDRTLDNLSTAYLANTPSVDLFLKHGQNTELASSSTEMSGLLATSTDTALAFTFPQGESGVYVGCTYPISWQSPETINSLEMALVDAGTRETVGQKTGGLARENVVEKDSQILNWKVGVVWPGSYYIIISKINGSDTEIRSKIFSINEMPAGISVDEREKICEESGGF